MRSVFTLLIYSLLLLSISAFISCADPAENTNIPNADFNSISANNNAKSANDETLDLGKIINLPFTPADIVFREDAIKSPSDSNKDDSEAVVTGKKLTAVLQFTEEDTAQIIAQAEKYKSPAPNELAPESWFPPELVAASQSTGDELVKGKAYAANEFYKPPYTNGKLTRIEETDYFVLELFAN